MQTSKTGRTSVLGLCFIGSGFSAVAYQVILSRYVQLIVGGTAYAVSALLVAFMLGMSIGSEVGGRLADRSRHPLRVYALAEGVIGLYALLFPLLYPAIDEVYMSLVPDIASGALGTRNVVRFVVGVTAFLLPSIAMGITTPAFARALAAGSGEAGSDLARIYGWNTLGAALGAFVTAYVLVPELGLAGSLAFASVINFAIALYTFRASGPASPIGPSPQEITHASGSTRAVTAIVLIAAFSTGLISFALEVVWTHLLAILLGNSVYAFGLMLGSFLLGLANGTLLARRLAKREQNAKNALGLLLITAGVAVGATIGVWDKVPRIFLFVADFAPTFALLESVRFAVALLLMIVPTTLFGASFPLLLACAATSMKDFGRSIGTVYWVNTLGAVIGALGASYGLLPSLGSRDALLLLAILLLLVGGFLVLALAKIERRRTIAALVLPGSLALVVSSPAWDFNTLNMASAIYLGDSAGARGNIIFQKEDPTGGLVTVVEQANGVRTLLTNGKFQGDNNEEVPIQHRLANIPTLFTSARKRALVVGLGTGVTLAAVAAHGFEEVVVAELSRPIIEAADEHFSDVNGKAHRAATVELIEEDGRSVLQERPKRYDLISVEVNSIWFAGVGPIYSREFYALASSRLRRNGVLLQWFPMHHVSASNLFVVVNTVRSVFPYVSVWTHRHQGFVVASREPLMIDLASIREDRDRPAMKPYLRELDSGSPLELLSDVVVTDRDVDRFLNTMARLLRTNRAVVSTDTWPTLEYETPKDILNNFLYFQNRGIFRRFRSKDAFPFRGTADAVEAALAEMAFARGWQDPRALPRLAEGWAVPGLSGVASEWLSDEIAGDEFSEAGLRSSPLAAMASAIDSLEDQIGSMRGTVQCGSLPPLYTDRDGLPLRVSSLSGVSIDRTDPEAITDGFAHPELTKGWRVRPDGRPIFAELSLDRARVLREITVFARPLDGHVARIRLFGRHRDGAWRPLAQDTTWAEMTCRGVRRYRLGGEEPLEAVRVEILTEGRSDRVVLHELTAFEAKAGGDDS